jgi:hypothetical protein
MRLVVVGALALVLGGCGDDRHPCGSSEPGRLGLVTGSGGECQHCFTTEACQAEYGSALEPGCAAYCKNGSCYLYCPGECSAWASHDAGPCSVGAGTCRFGEDVMVCDEDCAGGSHCQRCSIDEQCEAELGPGAECQTHCGTCCLPEDTSREDGGLPCFCI